MVEYGLPFAGCHIHLVHMCQATRLDQIQIWCRAVLKGHGFSRAENGRKISGL
jgi:hypothetical protein